MSDAPGLRGLGAGLRQLGAATLDPARSRLRAPDGTLTALRPKTLALLLLMLERAGQLLTRDEIMDALWPGLHVTDDSITQCITELRRALGAEAARLKTIARRGYLLEADPPAAAAPSRPPVVAVLPFRVPDGAPELARFADGLMDAVVGALAMQPEPVVISANTTRRVAPGSVPDAALGLRLGAGFIASGVLRIAGGALRLSVELTEAASGHVIWHQAFAVEAIGSFETEDRIAALIARALAPQVEAAALREARRIAPADRAAYHLLLEARAEMFRLEPEAFAAAGRLLHEAIGRDPGYPPSHAALADWYSLRIGPGWSSDRAADMTGLEAAVRRAIELDGHQARALAMLGHNHTIYARRHETALALFERALDAAPNDAEALLWTVPTHAFIGLAEEGVRRAQRAMALSPEDPLLFRYRHFLSIALYAAGDHGQAAEQGLRSAAANPRYTSNLRTTAAALVAIGRGAQARDLARQVLALEPAFRVGPFIATQAYRDDAVRGTFAQRLVEAGLPA